MVQSGISRKIFIGPSDTDNALLTAGAAFEVSSHSTAIRLDSHIGFGITCHVLIDSVIVILMISLVIFDRVVVFVDNHRVLSHPSTRDRTPTQRSRNVSV